MSKNARCVADLPERFNAANDLLDYALARDPDKTAVVDHQGGHSYSRLAERIAQMRGLLSTLQIEPEQRILLCLLDTLDFPTAFLGAIGAGVVPVPLNTLLTSEDNRWILDNSGARAVIVSSELAGSWMSIAADRPDVTFLSSDGGPWRDLGSLLAEQSPAPTVDTHRDDVAFWLYTSGSTGRPKGAMHTHASMRLTANLYGSGVLGINADDRVYSIAKSFFAYGLGNSVTFPLSAGATVILNKDRVSPISVTELLKAHEISVFCSVPTFLAAWLASGEAPARAEVPRLRLATSAGECLPAHLGTSFSQRYGCDIIDGLGSTEMLHVFLAQRPGSVRYGCTGRAVPGYELRLIGDDGREVEQGDIGELQVKGPTSAIGYWRNRAKSLQSFAGEWTRTGDKYQCDADGWFTFCGRSDDMLKVGGIYVSPNEVEEALVSHEAVLEAAVVGVPDAAGLIKPRAHVVLQRGMAGDDVTAAALQTHVKSRLAPYKYPREIVFADELPKTATGKIQRYRLRDLA